MAGVPRGPFHFKSKKEEAKQLRNEGLEVILKKKAPEPLLVTVAKVTPTRSAEKKGSHTKRLIFSRCATHIMANSTS